MAPGSARRGCFRLARASFLPGQGLCGHLTGRLLVSCKRGVAGSNPAAPIWSCAYFERWSGEWRRSEGQMRAVRRAAYRKSAIDLRQHRMWSALPGIGWDARGQASRETAPASIYGQQLRASVPAPPGLPPAQAQSLSLGSCQSGSDADWLPDPPGSRLSGVPSGAASLAEPVTRSGLVLEGGRSPGTARADSAE
jgi:hypothetical protein